MAIVQQVNVFPAQMWPQGDARDPLGIWGFRLGITGDATGGSIKMQARARAGLAAAYIYTCYSLNAVQLSGTITTDARIKSRLLTNWPDIDALVGVQGYSSARYAPTITNVDFTSPVQGIEAGQALVTEAERFMLLFDPRPSAGALDIIELEYTDNADGATYSFEGWGYFWDREVLSTPGGPRHPGSS